MEYVSVSEISQRWGVSVRQVQRLLAEGRIPGAKKYVRVWMIPADVVKPVEERAGKNKKSDVLYETGPLADTCYERDDPSQKLGYDLARVIEATTTPMPSDDPDRILKMMKDGHLRLPYEAELHYLRGEFAQALRCYLETQEDSAYRLRLSLTAVVAAISLGDFNTYKKIEAYLKNCQTLYPNSTMSIIADLALASVAVSVTAPKLIPNWLREGDFHSFPPEVNPHYILYIRARYFLCDGQYEAALGIAQTTLTFYDKEPGISITGIYLHIVCAQASYCLEREEDAEKWLRSCMRIALPHGFVTPFAEVISTLGGMVEKCLEQEFPTYLSVIIEQWNRTVKNWILFHNQFTKENITQILSLREYQIAQMVANHVPYSNIAQHFHLSIGRIKNIMLEIYQKLHVSGRDELGDYVLTLRKKQDRNK